MSRALSLVDSTHPNSALIGHMPVNPNFIFSLDLASELYTDILLSIVHLYL